MEVYSNVKFMIVLTGLKMNGETYIVKIASVTLIVNAISQLQNVKVLGIVMISKNIYHKLWLPWIPTKMVNLMNMMILIKNI